MKKLIYFIIVLSLLINNMVICYAEFNEEMFIKESEKVDISVDFNNQSILTGGYLFHGICFIEARDFINLLGIKYIDENYTKCDEFGVNLEYFGKFSKNKDIYYLYTDNRNYSIYDVDCFKTVFAEKVSNGKRECLILSAWNGSDSITINNKVYLNICALTYLFEDLDYMTKININKKNVIIKKYNKEQFVETVDGKYKIKSYCDINGGNEGYYQTIVENVYDAYRGINGDDGKEVCKKLLSRIWGIEVSDVYIKYDDVLDVYIVSPKGNYKKMEVNCLWGNKYNNVMPRVFVRGFDGKVLYPY